MTPKKIYRLANLFICLYFFGLSSFAQNVESDKPLLSQLKVVSEEIDSEGFINRVVEYKQGRMIVTEMIRVPAILPQPDYQLSKPEEKEALKVHIYKSKRCLVVKLGKKIIKTYKASLGPQPDMDKKMEGDRCTPEGKFTIIRINPKSKYNIFMQLNYPNEQSWEKFNERKNLGKIPKQAKIGGDIGIHGIWKGGDDMIEMGVGWTDGCIALKNKDVEELNELIHVGTEVYIYK